MNNFTYNLNIIITDLDANIIINPTLLSAIKLQIVNRHIRQKIPFKIHEPFPAWEYTILWKQPALQKPYNYLMGDLFTNSQYTDDSIIYEHTKMTLSMVETAIKTQANSPESKGNSYSWELVESKETIESKKCIEQNNNWKIAFHLSRTFNYIHSIENK